MSLMISVRLAESLVEQVDRERRRDGLSRAQAIQNALKLWIRRRRLEEAVRREHEGYERHPVTGDEFGPVLGAQVWPK
jgi:metal-responsive CopG/Arc/MetJ family transcriptional regulator